ncbi:MAG TPA: hypothetical protein VJL85_07360 [Gaiellaceae bacterium]|jgi:hypothetical protein|nr:hypothetical protein [Gaiellaceae bacterium]
MPSRKQRRRRAKERRHEWEEVWVDEEGNEVEPPSDDDAPRRNGKRTASAPARRQTGMRNVQPPSWRRVGKRGLIFAPLMFLTVTLLSGELTIAQRLLNTAFLLAFFLPFSYAMDALMYRMFTKRSGAATGRKG